MRGHINSRQYLGNIEGSEGNYDRAVRHFLVSAKMGDDTSVERIKNMYCGGLATKEHYTEALKTPCEK